MDRAELKRYMQVFYHRCIRLLGDPVLAMDALQETMTRYYEALERRQVTNPYYYIQRTCTNYCLDVLHKKKRLVFIEPDVVEELLGSVGKAGTEAEGQLLVAKLLETIEREDVELLLYRYVDQMTLQEMATLYGISDRGVKKRINRVESQIKKIVGEAS